MTILRASHNVLVSVAFAVSVSQSVSDVYPSAPCACNNATRDVRLTIKVNIMSVNCFIPHMNQMKFIYAFKK